MLAWSVFMLPVSERLESVPLEIVIA